MTMNNITKTAFSFIGGFIIGLILILIWNAVMNKSATDVPGESTTPDIEITDETAMDGDAMMTDENGDSVLNESAENTPESTSITAHSQTAGDSVMVANATLDTDGWIVIHEERDTRISNALGAVRRDAGTYTNVTVPLLRPTNAGSRYWVVLYSDNGDREFSLADDTPLRDANNDPITSSFEAQ